VILFHGAEAQIRGDEVQGSVVDGSVKTRFQIMGSTVGVEALLGVCCSEVEGARWCRARRSACWVEIVARKMIALQRQDEVVKVNCMAVC